MTIFTFYYLDESSLMRYLYRDQSNSGGAALLCSSALVLLCLIILLAIMPELAPAQAWVLLFILLLLAAAVAYHKLTAPWFMVELKPEGVLYHHRAGSWLLPWQAFAYARVAELPGQGELAFIGFKVTAIDQFFANSPASCCEVIDRTATFIAGCAATKLP